MSDTTPTADDRTDGIFAFMMEKCGGEEAVYAEFYGVQLEAMARQGSTLADARAVAEEQGWLSVLDGMKLASLVDAISRQPRGENHGGARTLESGRRRKLSKADRRRSEAEVLEYLGKAPWRTKSAIAENVPLEARRLGTLLAKMKKAGKIVSKGKRWEMKYALPGETREP